MFEPPTCEQIVQDGLIERYVARQLSDDEREALEAHFLTCDRCQLDIRLAVAIRDALAHSRPIKEGERGAPERPPLSVVAATPVSRRTLGRVAVAALAAAAVVVLVLARSSREPQPTQPRFREPSPSPGATIRIASPADREMLVSDSVRLVWHPIAADAYYSLTVTDEHGQVAWRHTLRDTVAVPPEDVQLAPGTLYYWFVDVLLPTGRTATTGVHELRIAP